MSPEKDGRDASGGHRDPASKSEPISDDVGSLLNPSPYPSSSTDEIKQILNRAVAGDLQIKLGESVLLGLFTEGERREFVASMEEAGLTWEDLSGNWDAVKEASSPAPALLYNILCERFTGILLETLGEPAAAVDLLVRLKEHYKTAYWLVSLPSLLKEVPDNAPQIDEKIGRLFNNHPFGWAGPEQMFITRVSSWGLEEQFVSLVENTLKQSYGTDYAPRLISSWEGIESVFSAKTVARLEALIDLHAPAAWRVLSDAALERSPSRVEKLVKATPEQGGDPQKLNDYCIHCLARMDLPLSTKEKLAARLCQLVENNPWFLGSAEQQLVEWRGQSAFHDLLRAARDRLERSLSDDLIIQLFAHLTVPGFKQEWTPVFAKICSENPRILVSACEQGESLRLIPGFKSPQAVTAKVVSADMPINLYELASNPDFLPVVLSAKARRMEFFNRCVQTGSANLFFLVVPWVQGLSQSTQVDYSVMATELIGLIEQAGSWADEIVRDPRFADLQKAANSSAKLSAGRSVCMEIAFFSPFTSAGPKTDESASERGYERTFIDSFIFNAAASLDRGSDGHDNDTYRGVLEDIRSSPIGCSPAVKEHPLGRFVVGEALGPDFDQMLNTHPVCKKLVDPPAKKTLYRYATWGDLAAREAFAVVSATLFDQLSPRVQDQVLGFDPGNLRTFFSLLESGVKRGFDLRGAPEDSTELVQSLRADAVTWISTKARLAASHVANKTSSMSDQELLLTLHTIQKLHWFYPEWKDIFVRNLLGLDDAVGNRPRGMEMTPVGEPKVIPAWSEPITITSSKHGGTVEVSDALSPFEILLVWEQRVTETWAAMSGEEVMMPTLLDGELIRTVAVRDGANPAQPILASLAYSMSGEASLILDIPSPGSSSTESFSTDALAAVVSWGEQKAAALKVPLRGTSKFVRAMSEPSRGEFIKLHGGSEGALPLVDIPNRTRIAPRFSERIVGRGVLRNYGGLI